ncbi:MULTISPECIES: DUF3237 domain-containing protein [Amycolatopsis]|uniref:UPF0311 protein ACFSUT_34610 n=1 Tax=Amycolatopsis albidoflavus TaxID=102226 RepID=A0ABW5I853_9PSEU
MNLDARVRDVGEIATRYLFDLVVDLSPRVEFGDGRVFFASAGGTFHGPRLHGEVLPGGGDWAVFRPDGTMTLDVRLALRTHDGALLHLTYRGRRTSSGTYFRTNPLFETGAEQYAWLNDVVGVGSGYLVDGGVAYRIAEVL